MVVLTAYTLPFQSDIGVDSIHFGIEVPASSMDVPVPPSGGFPISIAGRNYIVDTSFEPYRREAFKHKSIPAQRQSLHYTNSPDDGTISTEGLWRREARDWSLGAGQTYFDRKKSDDARFYRSKGINPWNQWEVSLLQDTKQQHSGTGTIKAIRVGNYSYFREADAIKFTSDWTSYTTVTGISGTVLDLTTDGYHVWVLTTAGLYEIIAGNTDGCATLFTWTLNALHGATLTGLLSWAGGRLIMALNNARAIAGTGGNPAIPSGSSIFDLSSATALAKLDGYLSANINSSVTTIPVDYLLNSIANNEYLQIEGETIQANASASAAAVSFTVNARGSGVAHTAGTPIYKASAAVTTATRSTMGWLYTHPNPQWVWTAIAGGSSQIYFSGHTDQTSSPDPGAVYRTTIQTTTTAGALGSLTSPVVALPMPAGEYPTAMRGYLNYVFVGTNKGIRMCETLNALDPTGNTGDLRAGPLLPNVTQPVTSPVTAIVGNDRYIYWAWNNYDSSSSGLGRLDLTSFIDIQAPAYASDLMITGQGTVSWLDWDVITDTPLISFQPSAGTTQYIYTADTDNVVSQGTIDSGLITYGIPDYKNAVSLDVNLTNRTGSANSSVEFVLGVDDVDSVAIGSYAGLSKKYGFSFDQQFGEQYRVKTNIYPATAPGKKVSPVLNRWTLKALPGIPSGVNIMAVLLMYEPSDMDGNPIYYDPYDEYAFLENLRQIQQVVSYVEGPLQLSVTVDAIEWLPERRRPIAQGGFHGDLIVTLKTITG